MEKCPVPGNTVTGSPCGRAQSITASSGTTSISFAMYHQRLLLAIWSATRPAEAADRQANGTNCCGCEARQQAVTGLKHPNEKPARNPAASDGGSCARAHARRARLHLRFRQCLRRKRQHCSPTPRKIETHAWRSQFSKSLGQRLHHLCCPSVPPCTRVRMADQGQRSWRFAGCWNAISSGPAGPSISVFVGSIHCRYFRCRDDTRSASLLALLSGDLTGAPNRHNNTAVATKRPRQDHRMSESVEVQQMAVVPAED